MNMDRAEEAVSITFNREALGLKEHKKRRAPVRLLGRVRIFDYRDLANASTFAKPSSMIAAA